MKKVLLRAPVLTQSGYGCHSRQIAEWLLSRNDITVAFQALPWGNTPWLVDRARHDGLVGKIMDRTCAPNDKQDFDVALQLQLPNEWDNRIAKYNVGITAAVETDKCNPEWARACNDVDLVVTPSNHAKANLLGGGDITTKIEVIPEAYSQSCIKSPDDLPKLPEFSTDFNFLLFGQITGNNPNNDRKNTFYALRWLFEEFKDEPNVGIVLKTNSGRNTKIDRNTVIQMLESVIKETRTGTHPRVNLLHGDMTDDEVAALYKHPQVKALVAPTRGEGFGLPILEACAAGLPVIATEWSGHMDFLSKGKFVSIYYQLKEIHKSRVDNKIFLPGMRWAEPSEQDFKKRTRKFFTSPSIPKEWALDLSKKVTTEYSLGAISERYDELLKGVLS